MLSDHERKALQDVERQLAAHDPDFTRSFEATGQLPTHSVQWLYELPRWAYRVAIGLAVTLGLMMMLLGAPWTGLLFAGLAVLVSTIQQRRTEPDRRERADPPSIPPGGGPPVGPT